MARKHNIPLRSWAPRWVGIVITFFIMISVMLLNGTYTAASLDISGSLGVLSEDISMVYYAASIGMVVAFPIIGKIRAIATTKTITLSVLILLTFLAYVCARTSNTNILILCNFLMGFLRAFMMVEMTLILRPFFSKNESQSEFYSYFYPISFGLGQISMIITAALAYQYQWQHMYYLIIGLQVLTITLILVFFRYGRKPIRIPFRDIDWISVGAITLIYLFIVYVCIYGRTNDWLDSKQILTLTLVIPFIIWFFLRRQRASDIPYLKIEVLLRPKNFLAYFFTGIAMFFNASETLISQYTTVVLRMDSVHSNELNLWMIPGFIIAGGICYWWFNAQIWRLRVLVFWAMACFVVYFAFIYFGLRPDGRFEFLYLPYILKGTGLMILLIVFSVYAVEGLDRKLRLHNAFFKIGVRSILAAALSSCLFSNLFYHLQIQHQMILGEGLDMQNSLFASRFSQSVNSALSQGYSLSEAQQMATRVMHNSVQIQSTMLSIKQITGYLLILSFVIMVVVRFIPFHKTLKFIVPKTGDDMV